jgi:ribosomal protein S18 acetylase RimI-like enzyme
VKIRSLGYRTDLLFLRFDGEVVTRDAYLVARIPGQPGYYWGNLLLFPSPPEVGDHSRWIELFESEFRDSPEVRHMTFGWDDPEGRSGEVGPFVADGFEYDESVVLATDTVRPPPHPLSDLQVRPLASDADWEAALACQISCRDDRHDLANYRGFMKRRMASLRKMTEAGLGLWYGAYQDGEHRGDLGIFLDGDVGRFQSVGTFPEHRRKGVCGTLVHRAGAHALAELGARTLVMVADPAYHAARVYESVGFRVAERQAGLCRWPGSTQEQGVPA